MSVTKRMRYEVLRRDNHACKYCGATAPEAVLTVDHVIPVSLGGTDDPTNLVTACNDCNVGKGSSNPDQPLIDDVSADALRWSDAVREAARALLLVREQSAAARQPFLDAWNNWTYCDRGKELNVPLPTGWEKSIDNFLAVGLPMEILCECVDIAMNAKKVRGDLFRYMCGCAWNKVAELNAVATAIAAAKESEQSRPEYMTNDIHPSWWEEE